MSDASARKYQLRKSIYVGAGVTLVAWHLISRWILLQAQSLIYPGNMTVFIQNEKGGTRFIAQPTFWNPAVNITAQDWAYAWFVSSLVGAIVIVATLAGLSRLAEILAARLSPRARRLNAWAKPRIATAGWILFVAAIATAYATTVPRM